MTRLGLIAHIQSLADSPHAGFRNRRKGMDADTAGTIVDAVVDEVLCIVEPFVANQWDGYVVVRELMALKSELPEPRPSVGGNGHR